MTFELRLENILSNYKKIEEELSEGNISDAKKFAKVFVAKK